MEDVLDFNNQPGDAKRPLVCLDEASQQILSAMRPLLSLKAASLSLMTASTPETSAP